MSNGATLERFTSLREHWVECLRGEDVHSVQQQLWKIMWNAASYRTINEARRLAPDAQEGEKQINGMLHQLLDECFVDSQLSAVRRLTDTSSELRDEGKKDRSIFSLGALLKDIKEHIDLLTRENIFAAEKLEYGYKVIEARRHDYLFKQPHPRDRAFFIPREFDAEPSRRRHSDIDVMAGVDCESRSRSDCVRMEIVEQLEKRLQSACSDINEFVNKFRAHAASPSSRSRVSADEIQVTFGDLFAAHESICRVTDSIGRYLLGTGGGGNCVPVPNYDQFTYIDRPIVETRHVDVLRAFWGELQAQSSKWDAWDLGEFFRGGD